MDLLKELSALSEEPPLPQPALLNPPHSGLSPQQLSPGPAEVIITSVLLSPTDVSHSPLAVSKAFYPILHFPHSKTLFTQDFHDVQLLVFLPHPRALFSVCLADFSPSPLHSRLLFSLWAISLLHLSPILYAYESKISLAKILF